MSRKYDLIIVIIITKNILQVNSRFKMIFFNQIWHFLSGTLILFTPMMADMSGYFSGEFNVKGEKMVRGLIGTALTVIVIVLVLRFMGVL